LGDILTRLGAFFHKTSGHATPNPPAHHKHKQATAAAAVCASQKQLFKNQIFLSAIFFS
jgi:hypothetical protein